jgi:hypothetical protein
MPSCIGADVWNELARVTNMLGKGEHEWGVDVKCTTTEDTELPCQSSG